MPELRGRLAAVYNMVSAPRARRALAAVLERSLEKKGLVMRMACLMMLLVGLVGCGTDPLNEPANQEPAGPTYMLDGEWLIEFGTGGFDCLTINKHILTRYDNACNENQDVLVAHAAVLWNDPDVRMEFTTMFGRCTFWGVLTSPNQIRGSFQLEDIQTDVVLTRL